MKVRERKYDNTPCPTCSKSAGTLLEDEKYVCDGCGEVEIDIAKNEEYLRLVVFKHISGETKSNTYQLCSWACVFSFIPKIKTNYFVDLPYLHYDKATKGQGAKDFIRLTQGRK